MDGSSAPWSGLRRNLLENIAKRLDSRIDVLRFRGVCSTWRSSFALPKTKSIPDYTVKLPLINLLRPDINPRRGVFFSLVESTLYFVQPLKKTSRNTRSWLIKVHESEETGQKLRLLNPLSRFSLANSHLDVPVGLNLLDYKVTEVSKAYVLEFVDIWNRPPMGLGELKSLTCKKVAVSSKTHDFAVMAIHTAGKLCIWKGSEKKWITINDGRERSHYEDVCYYEGKFYAVDCTGLTISVNDSSMEVTGVASPLLPYGYGGLYKHLVKSGSDLLLLDKSVDHDHDDFPLRFDSDSGSDFDSDNDGDKIQCSFYIYKLDEEDQSWVPMNSFDLEDRVLFVGDDCSFSISAQDFPGCKKNCIYFTKEPSVENREIVEDDYPGYDVALFDMWNRSAKPLSAVPACSKLFWPPPAWLKSGSNSSRPSI